MKYLIYGAGTIGITYAWLLSQKHDIDVLVKLENVEKVSKKFIINAKDLTKKAKNYEKYNLSINYVTEINTHYDGVLICVNRYQLKDVLPLLSEKQDFAKYFVFIQNNWNIKEELNSFLPKDKTIIAFPSNVGGGRSDNSLEVILFDEAVRIGGDNEIVLSDLEKGLNQVGIRTLFDKNIFDWLKVHYLQQSITAGAVLENGSFLSLAQNYQAIKKMVKAFREGIEVCRLQGVAVNNVFPANLFKYPIFLVAYAIQKMFLNTNTIEMVNNHMKKGMPEWIFGYKEVLNDGINLGLPMTVWKSYNSYIDKYLENK